LNLSDQRVHAQITDATKRRGGVFKTLANKINTLISEMAALKESRTVSGLGALPSLVDVANIWDMADSALYEDWDMTSEEDEAPAWLCSEDTRRGISAMVDRKRCREEMQRLTWQVQAAVKWFIEEEEEIQVALLKAGKLIIRFKLSYNSLDVLFHRESCHSLSYHAPFGRSSQSWYYLAHKPGRNCDFPTPMANKFEVRNHI
jgi:hypothetical protein